MKNTRSFNRSNSFLERAEKVIPLGSQTFSKSKTQYPRGVSPYFIERGDGPYVYDIDGNKFLDFVCSLGAITLGHNDPDVNNAVRDQLEKGVLFSLPSPIETEVAEMLVETIPCAEMVRFGKNGSDATAGAIRLARGYTKRDLVAVCGYHGWQDWYIGSTTRDLGVPQATKSLTKNFTYNDINSLQALFEKHPQEIAAVILEPVSFAEPRDDFLHKVREICESNGTVLIFDEIVTGARFAPGSAQELYGVTPDLTSLGKGLANGFPLSAIVGKAQIMQLMEEIFFSFTMGGETLSLAAAKATIAKVQRENTLKSIHEIGSYLSNGVRERLISFGLGYHMELVGHPSWTLFVFKDSGGITALELKTLFMQECQARGVLNIGLHFIGYSHKKHHIDEALAIYDEVFPILKSAIDAGDISNFLKCDPLVPLFKVR